MIRRLLIFTRPRVYPQCAKIFASPNISFRPFSLTSDFASKPPDMSKPDNVACCTEGNPQIGNYTGKGEVISLKDGTKVYRVGQQHKRGILCAYDIFGLDIGNTRHFCDLLSDHGFHVVTPDFFRGKPWSLANFPPKDMSEIMTWVEREGSWSIVKEIVDGGLKILRDAGVACPVGMIGFCWGGREVLRVCGEMKSDFAAGVTVHGSFMTPEMAAKVDCPLMLLPSANDGPVEPLMEVLNKKPNGPQCVHHRFTDVEHGFCTARGDYSDPVCRAAVDKVLEMSSSFFLKHVSESK